MILSRFGIVKPEYQLYIGFKTTRGTVSESTQGFVKPSNLESLRPLARQILN